MRRVAGPATLLATMLLVLATGAAQAAIPSNSASPRHVTARSGVFSCSAFAYKPDIVIGGPGGQVEYVAATGGGQCDDSQLGPYHSNINPCSKIQKKNSSGDWVDVTSWYCAGLAAGVHRSTTTVAQCSDTGHHVFRTAAKAYITETWQTDFRDGTFYAYSSGATLC
jgi:hypothetical protein